MDTSAAVETLRLLRAFELLTPDLRDKVARVMTDCGKVLSLQPGDVLIREGDVGGGSGYVLLSGSMHVSHNDNTPITLSAPALLGEMHQFNPRAQRTATVSAAEPCEVLKFQWFDFHHRATSTLSHEEQDALMTAMERLVWERFQHESICNAPAFAMLDDRTRLRTCLTLVWLAKDLHVPAGATLFEQGTLQGSEGYILLDGEVGLFRAGEPAGTVKAPGVIGATTTFDPQRKWGATAKARTPADLLHFEWPELEAYLIQRLGEPETRSILSTIEEAAELSV